MVLRRGTGGGIATGWGLLALGVGGGRGEAAAHAGDWLRAVQAGDGREIVGAAGEFFGDEPAIDRGCLCGYSVVRSDCGADGAGVDPDTEDAFGICGDCARGEEIEAACAGVLRGLAESRISSPPWVAELVKICGGEMIVPAGGKVTDAQMAEAWPEVIVLAWAATGGKSDPEQAYRVEAWKDVPAIRERRVFVVRDELLNTPGPPLMRGVLELWKVLHRRKEIKR